MTPNLSQRCIRLPVAYLAVVLGATFVGAPLAMGSGGGGGGGGEAAAAPRRRLVSRTARQI